MNRQQSELWFGYANGGKVVCVDFDGVIAAFDGWKGANVFGSLIPGARETLQALKADGWVILIFTSRLVTMPLLLWLDRNGIPYDDVNGRRRTDTGDYSLQSKDEPVNHDAVSPSKYWYINPEFSSIKPVASAYLDDMAIEQRGQNYDAAKWLWVKEELQRRFSS